MFILILGVALWWAAHLMKRIAPGLRAQLGRGAVAGALLVAVVLMVIGYRMSGGPVWWGASAPLKGVNNLLVLVAIYLFAADGMKTRIGRRLRHPQLTGFALWAFAHLLPNGDLPSFILFGGLFVWALVEMAVINRADPAWQPAPAEVPLRKEVMAAAGAVIVLLVMGLIHAWLGYNPFGA
ncbi:NnrU protein [Paracoccus halophilus]|uniref:Membrane protein n=1 Tax=Paracoccus halophilus TaxID=376733 RepID=A0A099F7U2_9RHOB|nr:NnrU family protein [Paracoccus halophilus]KGJ06780.1 membrane protein [Paracoccus halophilus]SFA41629.1 NnrU protein [Paracoccus halophilus]